MAYVFSKRANKHVQGVRQSGADTECGAGSPAGGGGGGLGATGLGAAGLGAAGLGAAGLRAAGFGAFFFPGLGVRVAGLGVAGLGVAGLGVAGLAAVATGLWAGFGVGITAHRNTGDTISPAAEHPICNESSAPRFIQAAPEGCGSE